MSNSKENAGPPTVQLRTANKRKRSLSNIENIQQIMRSPQKMIKIGTKTFSIPVNVVATRSKYFDAMFNRDFEEAKESGVIDIQIPNFVEGIDDIVAAHLLTGELPDDLLTETNLLPVIAVFQYLQTNSVVISSMFEILQDTLKQCHPRCRSVIGHKCARVHEFSGFEDLNELNFKRILKFSFFTEGYRMSLILRWITKKDDTELRVLFGDSSLLPTLNSSGIVKKMIWEIAPALSEIQLNSEIQKVVFPELLKLAKSDSLKLTLLTAMTSGREEKLQSFILSVIQDIDFVKCVGLFPSYGNYWVGSKFKSEECLHMIINSLTKANRTDVLMALFDAVGKRHTRVLKQKEKVVEETIQLLNLSPYSSKQTFIHRLDRIKTNLNGYYNDA